MLSIKEVNQLRKEITLNSLYIKDYENSLYIKAATACAFFDGYMEYLNEIARENKDGGDVIDIIKKYDNKKNLYNYYLIVCGDGVDPLLKDNYAAICSETANSATVIYAVEYGYIIAGRIFIDYRRSICDRITRNKVYYDKNDNPYFIKYRRKCYIDNFMRV